MKGYIMKKTKNNYLVIYKSAWGKVHTKEMPAFNLRSVVSKFEKLIAEFFDAPYAVATDSCTHAIELSLRYLNITSRVAIPTRTYISLPFIMQKLNINWDWKNERWENFYKIDGTNIYDAAVLWKRGSYIKDTFMCISFQFQKHLSIVKTTNFTLKLLWFFSFKFIDIPFIYKI